MCRNVYNWLSYGIVGNSVCRTWESCTLAFPCAVNRVIHDSIASYAHFHKFKLFAKKITVPLPPFRIPYRTAVEIRRERSTTGIYFFHVNFYTFSLIISFLTLFFIVALLTNFEKPQSRQHYLPFLQLHEHILLPCENHTDALILQQFSNFQHNSQVDFFLRPPAPLFLHPPRRV